MEFEARLIADDGTEYPLKDVVTVGRSDECDITLPSSKVSRQHARLTVSDGGITVEDLGSSNGTRLNDRAIGSAQSLMDGDRIGIDAFTLTVRIAMPGGQDDATVIAAPPDDDATVIAPPAQSAPPPPAASSPPPPPPPAGDLPGSWVDSGTSESTQFLSPEALAAEGPSAVAVPRHSTLAHFIVLGEDGAASDVFELEVAGADEHTWELGRDSSCDIQLDDPTVSSRHAQLVQRGGRWRMVNLISSNGIVVNGEKRLSVYLDDGDRVQLGESRLVFHAPEGASSVVTGAAPTRARHGEAGGRKPVLIGIGIALVLGVAAAAVVLW